MWSRTVGNGERPALFLHCGLASHQVLLPLAKLLPELTVTLVDLLGHGNSGPPSLSCDLSANASAVADVFDGPGLVFGHSFGAVTALRFALDHPERVSRLVLVEPVLFAAAKEAASFEYFEADFAETGQAMEEERWADAAQGFLSIWNGAEAWAALPPSAQKSTAERMVVIKATGPDLVDDQTGILHGNQIDSLHCPVHLIQGSETQPIIFDIHAALATRLSASLDVIDGAGHMAPITHPKETADLIRSKGLETHLRYLN